MAIGWVKFILAGEVSRVLGVVDQFQRPIIIHFSTNFSWWLELCVDVGLVASSDVAHYLVPRMSMGSSSPRAVDRRVQKVSTPATATAIHANAFPLSCSRWLEMRTSERMPRIKAIGTRKHDPIPARLKRPANGPRSTEEWPGGADKNQGKRNDSNTKARQERIGTGPGWSRRDGWFWAGYPRIPPMMRT